MLASVEVITIVSEPIVWVIVWLTVPWVTFSKSNVVLVKRPWYVLAASVAASMVPVWYSSVQSPPRAVLPVASLDAATSVPMAFARLSVKALPS